jgi:clan AA aspartic protease
MSIVYTEITLRNAYDVCKAEDGQIPEKDIRQTTISALVDTGAWTLVINNEIRDKLGLKTTGTGTSTLADGKEAVYNLAGPLEVHWKDRRVICEAIVIPDAADILLGAIPLEAMDLIVHPRKEEVVGAHGDQVIHILK